MVVAISGEEKMGEETIKILKEIKEKINKECDTIPIGFDCTLYDEGELDAFETVKDIIDEYLK